MEIDLMPAFNTACAGGFGAIVGKFTEMGSYQGAVAFAVAQFALEAFLHLLTEVEKKKWTNLPEWAITGGGFILPAIGSALYLHQAKLISSLAQGALMALGASLLSVGIGLFTHLFLDLKIKLKVSMN